MSEHLLLYASHDGQTKKIAQAIAAELNQQGLMVQCQSISGDAVVNLNHYASVLIGSPIRYGHHLPDVFDFIRLHNSFLNTHASGFFSVNLTARKPEKNRPETNPYVQKFLSKITWKPGFTGVMAGSLLYSRYRWFDRVMIQFIMKMTGGNTDASKDIEYTDWAVVRQFAQDYAQYLKSNTICCKRSEACSKPVDA
ncbi:menaquinone-dependent protoporphyrinogen IX dehydrogenase [Kistimonas asteriae]|uniref:menaquinone-dependent protoporphyrinogen IX dehydrogenase n=1 Tax=Kistimonas asteriae TaxID=517724 RepID=UPI001BA5018B|nr:menaquinone-dependent protoporphyrinogen IX dehydrogenase [Kistimonas asteriae]